ncbi:uncharacterized protein LOC108742443 [Agrilus planipennis]|uniref:Uncharacterized protein LOC108742443 n=1 Tax=Agrilus planipennis TaxID=224129 RepID=A0A1W4XL98_AGRPL|nr:uncharacterized protein LOC108742443 [Agrilus planipennis]
MGHKDVYNLLIDVYGADADIRDYSGRKPNQYKRSQNTVANKDTYSEYHYNNPSNGKHVPRTKHQSFLRKNFTPSHQRRYKYNTADAAPASPPSSSLMPDVGGTAAVGVHSSFFGSYNTGTY